MGDVSLRGRVALLEAEMSTMPQIEMPLKHFFPKGMYCRELFIPKGTLISGKIHKQEHIIILFTGEMSIYTEEGVVRIKAPYFGIGQPGTKRLGYAHEDTLGMNIHATDSTDLDEIEAEMTCSSFEEYETFLEAVKAVPQVGG